VTTRPTSAGDSVPPVCRIIEVRVAELRQLFNAIDPSPFNQRDLDPKAEEFIVGWSADLPGDAALALVVHLDRAAGMADEAIALRNAIHEFFSQRALSSRRRFRERVKASSSLAGWRCGGRSSCFSTTGGRSERKRGSSIA